MVDAKQTRAVCLQPQLECACREKESRLDIDSPNGLTGKGEFQQMRQGRSLESYFTAEVFAVTLIDLFDYKF